MPTAVVTKISENSTLNDLKENSYLEKRKNNTYFLKGENIENVCEVTLYPDRNIFLLELTIGQSKENILEFTRSVIEDINGEKGYPILYEKILLARNKNRILLDKFADQIIHCSFLTPMGNIVKLDDKDEVLEKVEKENPIDSFNITHDEIQIYYDYLFAFEGYNNTGEVIQIISKLKDNNNI